MEDWQKRLYDEEVELRDKTTKLEHFIATAKLPIEDMNLLRDQKSAMVDYLLVLTKTLQRINNVSI